MLPMVKSDGTYWITGDYRDLILNVVPEKFIHPGIEEIKMKIRGMKFSTQIDIKSAFFHMELEEESKKYTTILTPTGLRCMNVLPQG